MIRIVLFFTLLCPSLHVQATDMNPITASFRAGDASSLAALMEREVDIAVPASAKKCSPEEAVALLNSFFAANRPAGFTVVHNADKKDGGFLVGKLATAKGEFRVNITYRIDRDKAIIQSVRID
jgi:hypothetical protein